MRRVCERAQISIGEFIVWFVLWFCGAETKQQKSPLGIHQKRQNKKVDVQESMGSDTKNYIPLNHKEKETSGQEFEGCITTRFQCVGPFNCSLSVSVTRAQFSPSNSLMKHHIMQKRETPADVHLCWPLLMSQIISQDFLFLAFFFFFHF